MGGHASSRERRVGISIMFSNLYCEIHEFPSFYINKLYKNRIKKEK